MHLTNFSLNNLVRSSLGFCALPYFGEMGVCSLQLFGEQWDYHYSYFWERKFKYEREKKKKKKHHADQFDVYPLLQLFAFLLT